MVVDYGSCLWLLIMAVVYGCYDICLLLLIITVLSVIVDYGSNCVKNVIFILSKLDWQ